MVNSTQILTVSYGTFSCTLEGFDEPFNTMKSIAEYFRDLAADDRYFGAEPAQPDAEMLHRIAEREVNRRVEAQVADDGLVLRQIGTDAAAASAPAPATAASASAAPVSVLPAVEAAAAAPEPKVEVLAPQASHESVADKLSRIRAAVARARAAEDDLAQTYEEDEKVETGFMGSIDEAFSGPAFPDDEIESADEDEDADGEAESAWTTAQVLAEAGEERLAEEAVEEIAEEVEAVEEIAEAGEERLAEEAAEEVEAVAEDADADAADAVQEIAGEVVDAVGKISAETDEALAEFEDAELAADIAESANLDAPALDAEEKAAEAEDTVGADFFETVPGGDYSAADMTYGDEAEVEAEAPAFVAGFEDMVLDDTAEETDEDTLAALAAALNPSDDNDIDDAELAALRAGLDLDIEKNAHAAPAEDAAEAEAPENADISGAMDEPADDFAGSEDLAADTPDENPAEDVAMAELHDVGEKTAEAEDRAGAIAAHDAEIASWKDPLAASAMDDLVAAIAEETYSGPSDTVYASEEIIVSVETEAADADETLAAHAEAWEDEDEDVAEAEDDIAHEAPEEDEDPLAALADTWETDETDRETAAEFEDGSDRAEADIQAAADDTAVAENDDDDDDAEIEIEAEDAGEAEDGATPHGRIIRLKRRDFEAALAAGEIEEIEDEDDDAAFAEAEAEAEAAANADEDDDLEDTLASFAQAEQGDVADTHEDDEEVFDGDEEQLADDIRNLIGETSLSDEDEEDLLEELASVEREAKAMHPEMAEEAGEAADDEDGPEEGESDEDALNRLLSETNAKLGDSEGSRRRSAIAHLKAAVAATRADRQLKTDRDRQEKDTLDRYRDDLAKVVRPRRPSDDAEPRAGRGRPVADILRDRVAPLMLVSEQRVDIPEDERRSAKDPVHPRRIAATEAEAEAALEADEHPANPVSFADFAKKAGARNLPEILEAATAYATLVEGQDGVSRPQILRRAASLTGEEEISREQGLQSFGMLLRTGRIRKLGHGRFGVSDEAEVAKIARAGE